MDESLPIKNTITIEESKNDQLIDEVEFTWPIRKIESLQEKLFNLTQSVKSYNTNGKW